jgi:hypothetical protein
MLRLIRRVLTTCIRTAAENLSGPEGSLIITIHVGLIGHRTLMREHLPLKATPRTDYVYKRLVLPLPLSPARCKLEQTQSLQTRARLNTMDGNLEVDSFVEGTVILRDVPSLS